MNGQLIAEARTVLVDSQMTDICVLKSIKRMREGPFADLNVVQVNGFKAMTVFVGKASLHGYLEISGTALCTFQVDLSQMGTIRMSHTGWRRSRCLNKLFYLTRCFYNALKYKLCRKYNIS